MKDLIFFTLVSFFSLFGFSQNPICSGSFYSLSNGTIFINSPTNPITSTALAIPLPSNSSGFAVAPSFSFQAPNPTFWTVSGGTFWYYNGFGFINTGHSIGVPVPNPINLSIGGSKNYLYCGSPNNMVAVYSGTGNATFLNTNNPINSPQGHYDIVGDDLDNFYMLDVFANPGLYLFNSQGILTCSYTTIGLPFSIFTCKFAIISNSVIATFANNTYTGIISGTSVSFAPTPTSIAITQPGGYNMDYGNCFLNTAFISNISAFPTSSITCTNPSVTLSVSSLLSGLTYTWYGLGIFTPVNSPTVSVNSAGNYTCILKSCSGGTSIATFSVQNGIILPTPNTNPTSIVRCTLSPPTTITVTGANNYTWNPGGLSGSIVSVAPNATTIYSITGQGFNNCTSTQTIEVTVKDSPSLTLLSNKSSICIGELDTLTVLGANTYTWINYGTGTNIIASPTINTTYTVIGTSTNNCTNSAIITISVSLCQDIPKSLGPNSNLLQIFPNPADDQINITYNILNEDEKFNVTITNNLGQLIREEEIEFRVGKGIVKTDNLDNGVYFLTLKIDKSGTLSKRFVINR